MDFREALELARKELEEFRKDRELLRLRNACEKEWLATVLATDELLANLSFKSLKAIGRGGSFLGSWRGSILKSLS